MNRRTKNPRPRVVYVNHADPGEHPPTAVFDRFPTAGLTVAALADAGQFEVSAVSRTNGPSTAIVSDGIRWQFIHDRSRIGWRIARAVRRQRPDIVHVNGLLFSLPTLMVRMLCGRRVRIVVQHHGEPPGTGRTRHAQRCARRFVDAYLFTGGDAQAEPWRAARILGAGTRVFDVLESSASLAPVERWEARRRTGMVGSPAILWVGRLNAGKDPLTAVRSVAMLPSSTQLWMAYQSAPMEHSVRREISSTPGLSERVHLIGEIPHAEIAAWMSAADLFLSTSHHEGSGYALIEALACGCTPVVSDIAPHRAIIGPIGACFTVGDPLDCGAVLSATIPHPRDQVLTDFAERLSWKAVANQLSRAYRPSPH